MKKIIQVQINNPLDRFLSNGSIKLFIKGFINDADLTNEDIEELKKKLNDKQE